MFRPVRIAARTLAIFVSLQYALLEFAVLTLRRGRRLTLPERANWLHRVCRRTLGLLNIRIRLDGDLPRSGLLVCNHLSYLDIVVFGALVPCVFVAKIEVDSWPLIGTFARLGGALFIDRWKLRKLPQIVGAAEAVLRSGILFVAFPEATTTDGTHVLPFRPAMFEAAVRSGAPTTTAHISYTLEDGSFATSLCWFGKVNLVRHLAGCFSHRRIDANVRIGDRRGRIKARKTAALDAHANIVRLRSQCSMIGGQCSGNQFKSTVRSRFELTRSHGDTEK